MPTLLRAGATPARAPEIAAAPRPAPSAAVRPTRDNTGVYGADGTAATWTPAQTITGTNGVYSVTTDDAVFDRVLFDCRVEVKAKNATMRNCKVTGGSGTVTNQYVGVLRLDAVAQAGAVIEDCTLSPANPTQQCRNGITGHHFTARRLRIENVIDCFEIFFNDDSGRNGASGVLIEGCWGGDFLYISSSTQPTALEGWPSDQTTHNDWCQWSGTTGGEIRYNSMESLAGPYSDDQLGKLPAGRQVLSNMVIKADVGDIGGLSIHDNWCIGGLFAFNLANAANHSLTAVGSISNNHFIGGDTAHGRYVSRAISMPSTMTGTFDGNDDGAGNLVTVYHNG